MNRNVDNALSEAGADAADRVRVTDLSNQEAYRVRVEGSNEGSNLELTNTGASTEYLNMLATGLDGSLNSAEYKEEMGEDYIFRFHREGDAPASIMIPALAARSVEVNMKDPYTNNTMPTKLTLSQGETIVSKPCQDALLISMAIERFDSEVDGVITELHLKQEAQSIAEQLDAHVTRSLLKMLMLGTNKAKHSKINKVVVGAGPSSGKLADFVEDSIEAALAANRQFGVGIEDYIIGLGDIEYRAMQRVARKAGITGDKNERGCAVSAYLGTSVYAYPVKYELGDDARLPNVVVAPRRHVAVSFRERADGTVFDFIVSRNANKQSTTMEIVAVADVLAQGFTKMKKSDNTNVDVNLPLLTGFRFQQNA